jgi:hypothetical protein
MTASEPPEEVMMKATGYEEPNTRGRRARLLIQLLPIILASNALGAATGVTLTWDPNTEADLAGYKLYSGTASGSYTNASDVGNLTSNTVLGLAPGAEYFFAVTAVNTSGLESEFSNEVSYKFLLDGTNAPPTLDPINDVILSENALPQTITLTGITSGATNESQILTVTAISDNPALIPLPVVQYISPASTGTLILAPLPNASGTATVTVVVNDGQLENSLTMRSFVVTVQAANQAPLISGIISQIVLRNQSSPSLPFTVGDAETAASNLVVTASSSNTNLVSANRISLGGSDSNRSVKVTPEKGKTGTTRITLQVSDGSLSAATTFLLTVSPSLALALTDITPLVLSVSQESASGITIQWNSIAGEDYQVLYKESLTDPAWQPLSDYIYAEGPITAWTDSAAFSAAGRYYRVVMTFPSLDLPILGL